MVSESFWRNKRVFVTGHTGFKGAWLSLWLHALGAEVTGYALKPPTNPSLFDLCKVGELVHSTFADVRDGLRLREAMAIARPEIVIHMAAQSLVRASYDEPVATYEINVLGTVNLFEAVRHCDTVRAVVNVTSDKCYENREWVWGYREDESLGGYDPYSNSKACSELVTAAYRRSFFNLRDHDRHGVALASARAGNVIGGGDWAADRLVPDCIRAFFRQERIILRNPGAIRPWQHVLEPLSGYLALAERLCHDGEGFAEGWNFGPDDADAKAVGWVVEKLCELWGHAPGFAVEGEGQPHEAHYLKLDCSKARERLTWRPRWDLEQALAKVVEWSHGYQGGDDLRTLCLAQIAAYVKLDSRECHGEDICV